MKRLALVNVGTGSSFLAPIGLLFLSAWVKRTLPDWHPLIVDANWEEPHFRLLNPDQHWDAIGISAMTAQYESADRLGKICRTGGVGPTILGGVHYSICPESLRPTFNFAVSGEGEAPLVHILRRVELEPEIRGQFLESALQPMDLKDYPDLDWGLLNPRYFEKRPIRIWQDSVREMGLITSRGCPYHCRFCSTTKFWNGYRTHEPAWIIRQMESLAERGITHVQIFDDLFAVNKARLRDIASRFHKAGLGSRIKAIGCQSRANLVDRELCDLLRSMNVQIVSFGFESGSQRVLQNLKITGACVEANRGAVAEVKAAGMRVVGSMMFGSPGETWGDMWRSVFEILRLTWLGLSDMWFFVATPYPGTEFWHEAMLRGKTPVSARDYNWDKLRLCSKWPREVPLSDVPRWKFLIVWTAAQVALLPLKARKALRLGLSLLRKGKQL